MTTNTVSDLQERLKTAGTDAMGLFDELADLAKNIHHASAERVKIEQARNLLEIATSLLLQAEDGEPLKARTTTRRFIDDAI